ncbi:hypothetical protein, partial [Aeromonas caviae]
MNALHFMLCLLWEKSSLPGREATYHQISPDSRPAISAGIIGKWRRRTPPSVVLSWDMVAFSLFREHKDIESKAKQSKAKQSKAKQSKAKQSKAKQSKAKQSKAKQSKA